MNFANLAFWKHLLECLIIIAAIRFAVKRIWPDKLSWTDKFLLACLDIFLLSCVNRTSLIIFISLALFNYGCLCLIGRLKKAQQGMFLAAVIPLHLIPLFYYKYADFSMTVLGLPASNLVRNLIIPAGISFYTFQKVALLVDYYRSGEKPPPFLDYFIFSGFFPLTVAGPIERAHHLLPQMQKFSFTWNPARIEDGVSWIVLGLFYKIGLADNLSAYLQPDVYVTAWDIWFCNLIFGLKIYFDFAGYSLVALGLARCFGIELSLNFQSPYLSTSMKEFWTNWHVTLNRWFRDYIYFPLGGSRIRLWFVNIAFVFLLSGAWHGAGWNYILWGLFLGLFTIVNHTFGKILKVPFLSWVLTMLCIFFTWLFFYETRLPVLAEKLRLLATPSAYPLTLGDWNFHQVNGLSFVLTKAVLLVMCGSVLVLEYLSVRLTSKFYAILRHPVASVIFVVLIVVMGASYTNAFIYFAF